MIRSSTILLLFLLPFAVVSVVVATDLPATANAPSPSLEATFEFARGKLLADDGDFQGALEAFRRTIELDPTDPYALMEVARFHSELAQISRTRQQQLDYLEDGLEYIEQAKRLEPDNPDVLRLYAETHLRLANELPGSLPLALGAYERLRVQAPGDLQVLMSLAQIYLWEQRSELAADVLKEATRYSPRNRMIHSMLVDALAQAGRSSEAESSLEALVEIDPENLEVRQQLAEIRGERGDHAGAIELLEASIAMDPDPADRLAHTRLRRTLARAYHLSGRHADALREVDALQRDSNAGVFQTSPAAQRGGMHRLRAAILSAMTRYAEAAESFRGVVDNGADPDRRAQDALLLARLYERDGAEDLAVDVVRRELGRAPAARQMDLRIALAGIEQRSGRFDQAAAVLREGIESIDAEAPGASLVFAAQALAEVLVEAGQATEAIEILGTTADRLAAAAGGEPPAEGPAPGDLAEALRLRRALVAVEAEDWAAVDRLADPLAESEDRGIQLAARQLEAQARASLGELDDALDVLASTEGLPGQQLLAARLDLLFEHGEEERARDELSEVIADGTPDDLFFAAQVYQRREHYADAVPLYERLIEGGSDDPNVLFSLAAAYERSGRYDEAVTLFERLLDLRPDHPQTLNYLGYMWIERAENLDRALAMVQKAVAADPDNGAFVDSLGWAYYQLGRYDEARAHLEWAARLETNDPTVFEHLGDVYVALDEMALAGEALRRALELDVDQEAGREAEIQRKLDALDAGP